MEQTQLPPKLEKQILLAVLKTIDKKPSVPRKLHWRIIDFAIWVAVGFFLFRAFSSTGWFQALFPFAMFGFGMLLMFIYLRAQSIVQWPLIGRYLDRSKMEARVRELEA